jgi:glycosyltransferase involved in cell wall biosynthesis
MQQTTFPFEAIVHDDASTDGTTEIIREFAEKFPNIIKPLYEEENQWSKHDGRFFRIIDEHLCGKYIALCDGDDYWDDPYKLQKQVDFLEGHADYTLTHTSFRYIDMQGNAIPTPDVPLYRELTTRIKNGFVWHNHLVESCYALYSTIVYRNGCLEGEQSIRIDHNIIMSCARRGKIQYLDDDTTCYRIDSNSMMRTRPNNILKSIHNSIFYQLLYYCSSSKPTHKFYRYNLSVRVAVAEGILSSIAHYSELKVSGKVGKFIIIVFARPLNFIMLPVALCKKIMRKFS